MTFCNSAKQRSHSWWCMPECIDLAFHPIEHCTLWKLISLGKLKIIPSRIIYESARLHLYLLAARHGSDQKYFSPVRYRQKLINRTAQRGCKKKTFASFSEDLSSSRQSVQWFTKMDTPTLTIGYFYEYIIYVRRNFLKFH